GRITDSPRGTRWITTLRKEPITTPTRAAMVTSAAYTPSILPSGTRPARSARRHLTSLSGDHRPGACFVTAAPADGPDTRRSGRARRGGPRERRAHRHLALGVGDRQGQRVHPVQRDP